MKFTIFSFFSNLAGSILGTLGGLGFLMSQFERRLETKRKPEVKVFMDKIVKRRTEFMNLNIVNQVEFDTEKAKEHSTDTILNVPNCSSNVLDTSLNTDFSSFQMFYRLSSRGGTFRKSNKILPLGHEII